LANRLFIGGIEALLRYKKTGFKPSILSNKEHELIEAKINYPKNGLSGYVELQN